ncbi:energy-coupling factor transporter transmembrane protein EcfT [Ammoniphilus sp. YIM 78166]|uniref:energy-coupling factor transporter transmembrane component T family protein n=1 Tax=Ammoniphilus sp. YIM 78166 TaxID=1644106 RepID=UPI0010702D31|nr:energy-coupling factor transporter transmembrane component T [Ammoniphilus sp. YIM 78166]
MNFLTQIPIGQFIPGSSFVHRLDPRAKLLFVVFFVGIVFWAKEPATYGLLIGFVLLSIVVSGISPGYLLRSLRAIIWIILFTVIIHLFMTKGGEVWYTWKWIEIHEEGVKQAISIALRLILLILMASLLTLTTSPIDLTDGIERLFSPLARFGFPAHELAMMMSIALRFIPTLIEETDKIMKAQISRGADFESGNLLKRVKNMVPLLIPLFISAFRRAEELALAMESRGYRGAIGRTKLRELTWTRLDLVLLGIAISLVLAFFILKSWG